MADEKHCVCGHLAEAHEHYRRGSDCAICGAATCRRFRAARGQQPPAASTERAPRATGRDTVPPTESVAH